jgi:hypothetical protein
VGVLVILIALGLGGAAVPARADSPDAPAPPKANSFAPRHGSGRTYGAPIQPQILHSHKRKPVAHHSSRAASASRVHAAPVPQP